MTKNEFAVSTELKHLFIPAKERTDGKSPLLILLHGVGANERSLLGIADHMDPRFAILSLRGPLTVGPENYAWFNVNFTTAGPVHNPVEAESSRKLLKKLLEELRENPEIDSSRIFIFGFSQGTIMGLSLALTEPSLFYGLVAISGRTLQEVAAQASPAPGARPQVLLLHGRSDTKLPFFHGEATEATLKKAHIDYEFKSYDAGHEINESMVRDIKNWLALQLQVFSKGSD